MYGGVEVVLKPSVRDRSTFTIEDSFMNFEHQDPDYDTISTASRLSNPRIGPTVANKFAAKLADGDFEAADELSRSYTELQVHGGVKTSDIEQVRLPAKTGYNDEDIDELTAKLAASGIKFSSR